MPAYRVFATCEIGEGALDRLRERGYELEVYPEFTPPPKALLIRKVSSGIDALITTLRDTIDEEVLQAGKGTLKVIAQGAVGYDNIDREAATRLGIPFTNTPGVLTEATAEFALFMLGSLSRKMLPSETLVRENGWSCWHPSLPFLGNEVTGKTVAVVGVGRIGRAFALKCTGLRMNILCCNRSPVDSRFLAAVRKLNDLKFRHGLDSERCQIRQAPFPEALREADYVSLHVPLTERTRYLMNGESFSKMKPTGYLINTSRGKVVDEGALCEALRAGRIAGAALDVFESEPLPPDSPLRDPALADRLRLFHHFASGTVETRLSTDPARGMAGCTVEALIRVLEEKDRSALSTFPPLVNRELFQPSGKTRD